MISNTRIEILKVYLAEDPDDSFSRYALALEYLNLNDLEQSVSLLRELIVKDPDYLAAYYQLGKILERKTEPDQAIKIYQQGIEIAKLQHNTHTMNELNEALLQLTDDIGQDE